jgi:putative RecB family exonuclease
LPQPPSPAATKGTIVHKALEYLMLREPAGRTETAALDDLDQARRDFADHPDVTGLDLNEAEWRTFHTDLEHLVHKYFQLEDPTLVTPIGLELKLEAKVGDVRIRGIIDRLELDADGGLVVTDYKTGAVPQERYEQSRLGGVHIYSLLCQYVFGQRPARVQLLYLSKPEAIIATPSEQSVRGVANKTKAIWSAVERACASDDFRPNPGRLCDWCAYKAYCPSWGGDPAAADLARDLDLTTVPVELPLLPA